MATQASQTDRTRALLTPGEVARLLRVTPRTVRRWGASGALERVRLGGRLVRYRAEDVEALMLTDNDESPASHSEALATNAEAPAHVSGS